MQINTVRHNGTGLPNTKLAAVSCNCCSTMGHVRMVKVDRGDGLYRQKETWEGSDYAYRSISMERLGRWTYNRETRTWDREPDPPDPTFVAMCDHLGITFPSHQAFELPPSFPPPDP